MISIPRVVKRFARVFTDNGHELFVVGGAVRDALLGNALEDYDFATSATPREVRNLFRRVIPTGIRHGTVTVLYEGHHFEVTTYRVEGSYSDARHPDSVVFTRSLQQDLERRDLTINAIALNPATGAIIDPHGGRDDLKARVIRTVGNPDDRFSEDALRMVRAVRFAAVLRFETLPEVLAAVRAHAPLLEQVARERIGVEIDRIMGAVRPSVGWILLRDTTLLDRFMPELREDEGGPVPVFEHLCRTCDCAPADDLILRWAALLHDIAKPRCAATDERGLHFHGHDEQSARMSEEILTRLRYSGERVRHVSHLVRHHMFGYTSDWSDAAVRRFLVRVGVENVSRLTALRRADACGKTGRPPVDRTLDELESRAQSIASGESVLSREQLAVGGRDLMETLDLVPGPHIGVILEELMQTVLDDPSLNDRESLLRIAGNIYRQRL